MCVCLRPITGPTNTFYPSGTLQTTRSRSAEVPARAGGVRSGVYGLHRAGFFKTFVPGSGSLNNLCALVGRRLLTVPTPLIASVVPSITLPETPACTVSNSSTTCLGSQYVTVSASYVQDASAYSSVSPSPGVPRMSCMFLREEFKGKVRRGKKKTGEKREKKKKKEKQNILPSCQTLCSDSSVFGRVPLSSCR